MNKFFLSIFLKFKGKFVGEDEYGNKYYETNQRDYLNRKKRYCLFNGRVEATKIPPEWHCFMHYQIPKESVILDTKQYKWQKRFLPDLTLSSIKYLPKNHPLYSNQNSLYNTKSSGNPFKFKAWSPNSTKI